MLLAARITTLNRLPPEAYLQGHTDLPLGFVRHLNLY